MEETHFYSSLKEIGNFQKSNEVRDMGYQQYYKLLSMPHAVSIRRPVGAVPQ